MKLTQAEGDSVLGIICMNEVEQEDDLDFKDYSKTLEFVVTSSCLALYLCVPEKMQEFIDEQWTKQRHAPASDVVDMPLLKTHTEILHSLIIAHRPFIGFTNRFIIESINNYRQILREVIVIDCLLDSGNIPDSNELKERFQVWALELLKFMPGDRISKALQQTAA